MSASTVSITANPTTRRRSVVDTEQKKSVSNLELFPGDGTPIGYAPTDEVEGTAGAAQLRDLSNQSIRGEAGGSRNAVQAKKTSSGPRSRKASAAVKPEKPLWQTVLSICIKNFALIVVLWGLILLIRSISVSYEKVRLIGDGTHLGLTDFEGRIAEVEKLVKTTTKMVQVQVEAVDKIIESEIGGLKEEFNEKIEVKAAILEKEINKVMDKTQGLEKSVAELKAGQVNWVSRTEFEKIYDELKRRDGVDDVTLQEIKLYARGVVEKEIAKHAADGLGMVDYALASGGATVLKHSEPYIRSKVGSWLLMAGRGGVHPNAVNMITPSFGEPGKCFSLKGSEGFVQIRLRSPVIPEAITLEHVAKSVAYDRTSAPKGCRVSGWLQRLDQESNSSNTFDSAVGTESMLRLADFTYDLEKSNAQTYPVIDSSPVVDTIRLDILSNHGNSSHTCIYRLRVHGHEPAVAISTPR